MLVSLVLLTLDYRQGETGVLAALQRGALTVFGPVQEGFAAVVRPVGGFFGAIGDLASLRAQNEELAADNEELREQVASLAELLQENAALRAQLEMRERLQLTTTGARVFAQPPGSFSYSRLLDVGAEQGVRVGQAVVNADGLVGKITEVTANNARLQLATTPSEGGYAVRIAETGEVGLLSGRGRNPYRFVLQNPEAEVERGSEVVTQMFGGTAIPDGIPVGIVEDSGGEPGRFLTVRPYVDFSSLDIVQVVLNAPEIPADLPQGALVPLEPAPRPDPPQPSRRTTAPGSAAPGTASGSPSETRS